MWTFVWLAATTAVGWAIGQYAPDVAHPYIGAAIGFAVGGICRLIVAMAGGDGALAAGDCVGDVIGAFFD